MTVEAWTPAPVYPIAGTGPYAIPHPYALGAIQVYVVVDGARVALSGSEITLTPTSSAVDGDLYLSPTTATTHAGRDLIIDRRTPDEQGWVATQGEREAGLAAQLDRTTFSVQEVRRDTMGSIRIRGEIDAFDWGEGTVPVLQDGKVISGPSVDDIAEAGTNAATASAAAEAAAASAAEALAKENSMLRWRGAWITATDYAPSDIVFQGGSSYVCVTAHTSGTFATDLAATRWALFAQQGAAGPGSGDMLKTENLSGLANVATARTNLGLQTLATKATAAFADIDPAAVITDVETLAANKLANALPAAKAVTDYVDPGMRHLLADKSPSGVANLDFTEFNNTLYLVHQLELFNFRPGTDSVNLLLRLSTNGGLGFDAGATDYRFALRGWVSNGNNIDNGNSANAIFLNAPLGTGDSSLGNGASEFGWTGSIWFFHASLAGVFTKVKFDGQYDNANGHLTTVNGGGQRQLAQDTDAARLLFSGGNIASCRARLWGHF